MNYYRDLGILNVIDNSGTPQSTFEKIEEVVEFTYVESDGQITITGYSSDSTDIVIPSMIDGKVVVAIHKNVFQSSNITSITIPATVNKIDSYAFDYCENLTSVNFEVGSKLTSISDNLFSECSNLTDIIIPEGVTTIEFYAFYNCKKLENIIIPNSVVKIDDAFGNCNSLKYNTYGNGSYLGNEANPYHVLILHHLVNNQIL